MTVCHSSAGPGVFTSRAMVVDVGVQDAAAEGAKVKANMARVAEQQRNRIPTARLKMASMVEMVVEVVVVTEEESKAVVVAKVKREAKALLMAVWLPAGAKVMPGRGRAVKTAATEPPKAGARTLAHVVGAGDEMALARELAVLLPRLRGVQLLHRWQQLPCNMRDVDHF